MPAHVGGAVHVVVDPGVVGPDRLAGAGVEGRRLPEGGADVDQPVRHQRRRLERGGADAVVLLHDGARQRRPAPRDSPGRRKFSAVMSSSGEYLVLGGVPAEVVPLAVGHPRLRAGGHGGERDRGGQHRARNEKPKPDVHRAFSCLPNPRSPLPSDRPSGNAVSLPAAQSQGGESPRCIRPVMHPAWPRCSANGVQLAVACARYAPSSRLAARAPRRSRCNAGSHDGLLVVRHVSIFGHGHGINSAPSLTNHSIAHPNV